MVQDVSGAVSYEVCGRREVPLFMTGRGLFTNKLFCEVPAHAGELGICVRLASGFSAWGFSTDPITAEANAVAAALSAQAEG